MDRRALSTEGRRRIDAIAHAGRTATSKWGKAPSYVQVQILSTPSPSRVKTIQVVIQMERKIPRFFKTGLSNSKLLYRCPYSAEPSCTLAGRHHVAEPRNFPNTARNNTHRENRRRPTPSLYPPRCSPRPLPLPRPRPLLLPLPRPGGGGGGPEVAGGAGSSTRAVTSGGPFSFFATSSRTLPSVDFGSAPASSFFSFPFFLDFTPAPLKAASICLDDTSSTGRPLLGTV